MRNIASCQEFEQQVVYKSIWRKIAISSLSIFAFLLIWNIISTAMTMSKSHLPSSYWWEVFFSTEGDSVKSSIYLTVIVYGMPIVFALALLTFILDIVTKKSNIEKLYHKYQESGKCITVFETDAEFKVDNTKNHMVLGFEKEQDSEKALDYIQQYLSGLDKKAYKKFSKTLFSANQLDCVKTLQTYFPELPESGSLQVLFLAQRKEIESNEAFLIPYGENHYRLYFFK